MSYSTRSFVRSLTLLVTLSLFSCLVSHQAAAARNLQQLNSPVNLPVKSPVNLPVNLPANMAAEFRMPAWITPSLYKPAMPFRFPAFQEPVVPPHFLPLLPFPGMPSMPSMPAGPTYPSLPAVPIIPTTPPAPPSVPENPSDVPPAFPVPTAKPENSSGDQMSP